MQVIIGTVFVVVALALAAFLVVGVRRSITTDQPVDRLQQTVRVWLDDERPAWETVAAFERDVENIMRGRVTAGSVSRMPLRPARSDRAYDDYLKEEFPF